MLLANKNTSSPVGYIGTDELLDQFALTNTHDTEVSALYEELTGKFQAGKVIDGTVMTIDSHGVLVDISYKSDGLIPSYEFSDFELKKIKIGDTLEVLLDRLEDENGNVVLSYQKAKSIKAWDRISELAAKDEPVRGVVTHKVKGGLSVDVGVQAFLPGSQVDMQRVNDFDQFVGQEVLCKILKINRKRGNIIVSRRRYMEEQRAADKQKALEILEEGAVMAGVVKNITNYGAFVDIGGVDGLLHITDMSWGRISHPSEMLKIGQTVNVKVISFDKANEKISLGMKQLTDNPWSQVEDKYPVGAELEGRISSITDYGLFVEIEKGIEGLVHISEISWTERITNLSRHYTVGDTVKVKVVAIDKDNRRMSLSIKQLASDPWQLVEEKFKIGDSISGKVTNVTDFGVFVQLLEGVDGLVHVSDISWTEHVSHPSDKFKKGDTVDAVILAIDSSSKKISLGIKQLDRDPWERIEEEYPIGASVEGSVSKITNFGAFVRLPSGVEGLVHISELSDQEVEKPEDVVKVGDSATFKVIKVNKADRKLGLSLKAITTPSAVTSSYAETSDDRKPMADKPSTKSSPRSEHRAQPKQQAREMYQRPKAAPSPASPRNNPLQQALKDYHEASGSEGSDDESEDK